METQKRKRKKWPFFLLLLLLLAAGGFLFYKGTIGKEAPVKAYASYTVRRGDLASTVTGSGKLQAADRKMLELPLNVEVEEILVEAGDAVRAGEALVKMDTESLELRLLSLSAELSALDARIANRTTTELILSPAKGRIKYMPVEKGDKVLSALQNSGALLILSADGLMEVEIETAANLSLASEVKVEWEGGSAEGSVSERTRRGYRITLSDKEAPYLEIAKVYDGVSLLGEGLLEIHAPIPVYGTGGTIDKIHYELNESVKAGAKLFTLKDAPLSAAYRESLAEREKTAEALSEVAAYLEDPCLYAPEGGVVSRILVTEGEKTLGAEKKVDAMELLTGGASRMYINVDELDIDMVELGQPVSITLDAYAAESFAAEVSHISKLGTPANSITTYQVELTLPEDPRLLEGMNGSAVITVSNKEDVLLIPVEAIHEDAEGSYVYVENADGSQSRTAITTGLSNGSYAEVTSGLAESDVIVYVKSSAGLFPFGPMAGMTEEDLENMRANSFGGA